jgi:hypothetical protein
MKPPMLALPPYVSRDGALAFAFGVCRQCSIRVGYARPCRDVKFLVDDETLSAMLAIQFSMAAWRETRRRTHPESFASHPPYWPEETPCQTA